MCEIAGVSRKCYHDYLERREKPNPDTELIKLISLIQFQFSFSIGYRAMTTKLRSLGYKINRKKVRRIMKENDLLSTIRRKKYSAEVYQRRKEMKDNVPENLLNRHFHCGTPRKIFVTDITYLYTSEGVFYLNIIEDLFNREIVAWKIGVSPDAKLCIDCVKFLSKICNLKDTIIHSDQGSTYTSYDYRNCLAELGVRQSCSEVGQCWDNAAMESFNGILKTECLYAKFGMKNFKECKIEKLKVFEAVANFINYYNNFRQKQLLGNLSPREYLLKNPLGTLPVVA